MYVRLLYGPKAGETDFILAPIARQLIAQGRAEDPNCSTTQPVAEERKPAAAKVRKGAIVE